MRKDDDLEYGRWRAVLIMSLLFPLAVSQSGTQSVGLVRLSGGQGPHEGNVEVAVDGVWGYVCDDDFGFNEADVMCKELGYDVAETFTRNNHFGNNSAAWRRSSVKFWLSDVNCSLATSLTTCTSAPLGQHLCGPTEIAGVSCRGTEAQCEAELFPCSTGSTCLPRELVCNTDIDCDDGSDDADTLCNDVGVTRLTSNLATSNFPDAALGVVYMKYNGAWGTVCDNDFDNKDAKVICRSLGYEGGWSLAFSRGYFGLGREGSPIWVGSAGCRGDEEWIGECLRENLDQISCVHIEDSSVFCYDGEAEVRLAGGEVQGSGVVEMRLGGEWGAVCDARFDDFDAQVVCKMLGYDGDDSRAYTQAGGAARTVWQMHLDCLGQETHVQQCGLRFSNTTCTSTTGVVCSSTSGALNSGLQSLLPKQCGEVKDASQQFLTGLARLRFGETPTRFDHPWLVSLRSQQKLGFRPEGSLKCGGTIISEYYIVTAAHCLQELGTLNLVVRVGDYNADFREQSEEEYFIDKIWQHEEFSLYSFLDNDIALLKVEPKDGRGIRFGSRVTPLCMPHVGESYENLQDCSITGWGRTTLLGNDSSQPNEGKVFIRPGRDCEEAYVKGTNNFTSSFVCAGSPRGDVNSCIGDSGGPLSCRRPGETKKSLYGIVSSGSGCEPFLVPDSLTRVTKYLRWIYDKISRSG